MPLGSLVDPTKQKKESMNWQISEIIQVKHNELKKRTRAWGFYLTHLNTCIIGILEEDRRNVEIFEEIIKNYLKLMPDINLEVQET